MSITILLRRSLVFLCIMTALTCVYTGALTLTGKALFPFQAEGSIITAKGRQYSQPPVGAPRECRHRHLYRQRQATALRRAKQQKPCHSRIRYNVAGARGTHPAGASGKIRPAHSSGSADGIRQRA